MQNMTNQNYQSGKVKYRNKRECYTNIRNPPQRYSGDFDLYTKPIAQSKHPPAPLLQQYNFRRAKSSEWDGDILDQNVKSLKKDPLPNFHLGISSASNMQTLDKRISASSDQLDCSRQNRNRLDSDGNNSYRRTGYGAHTKARDTRVNSDVVFKYKGEKYSKNQYFCGNSENCLNISESSQREKGRKHLLRCF